MNKMIKLGVLIIMLFSLLSASAYDIEVDEIYYNITSFSDLTCEVTSGDYKYEGDVIIPSEITYNSKKLTVTSIGNQAFAYCGYLTSVIIPNTVTSIGKRVFWYSSLMSITIPNSVTDIGEGAFGYCKFKSITIPNSVTKLQSELFYSSSLETITLPNSIKYIQHNVFENCRSLISVTIPESIISIGGNIFEGCTSLTYVPIPNSYTRIPYKAFKGCVSLTSVTIPDSVISIGESAFEGCTNLTSVTMSDSVKKIENSAFKNCYSLVSIILSNSLELIPYSLFSNCRSLASLEIPGSVENISEYYTTGYSRTDDTFENCTNLHKLSIDYSSQPLVVGHDEPYGFKSDDYWGSWVNTITELYVNRTLKSDFSSFSICNLEKLELGENVEKIQIKYMDKLEALTTIYSYALTPPELPDLTNKQYLNIMVYVPEEAIDAYRNAPSWKNFWNLAPINGINDIENDIDSNAPVHIYTINGMEMRDKDSLPAGIYIMRQGSKTKNIIVGH